MNRKQKQREEVRTILHAMKLELAAQRLAEQQGVRSRTGVRLDHLLKTASSAAA